VEVRPLADESSVPPGADSLYDSMASRYDRWYESPVNARIDEMESHALGLAVPVARPGGALLDVGSGTGHWYPLYEAKGYKVVGIDISSGMLAVARRKFGAGLGLVRCDAMRLPLRDDRFDVVCAVATLHLIRDPADVLHEMYRCLKPGGRMIVGALNAHSFLGLKRRVWQGDTFREARFLTVRRLKMELARYGLPSMRTCAFFPPSRLLLPVAGWIEAIAGRVIPTVGQFIVAYLDKPGDLNA
jgi:ubiquinone/menaquinone biosynthesis C-methylase UbiE